MEDEKQPTTEINSEKSETSELTQKTLDDYIDHRDSIQTVYFGGASEFAY